MKQGRIRLQSATHSVFLLPDGVALVDGTRLNEDPVQWLPPFGARSVLAPVWDEKLNGDPRFAVKSPAALTGHQSEMALPEDAASIRCRPALAVLIGLGGKHIARADAANHVAGYTIAIDTCIVSRVEGEPVGLRETSRDRCTPLGPWLVDAADVSDPMSLDVSISVNGTVMRTFALSELPLDIAGMVEHLSSYMTLSTGDLILAVAPGEGIECRRGDEVAVEIDGIGRLANAIRS